ncbi:MAG: thiamine pyrophosphate-binding protein [Myxococcota bacterium]|nr:thiamine pyrophosphate-binding protein [Myxococcota bacterium]
MSKKLAYRGSAAEGVADEVPLPATPPLSESPPGEGASRASIVQLRPRADALPVVLQRTVDVFLRYLKAEGVTHVFGIVGGLLYPFFAAIENDPELYLVHVKHEEGAAFMADGYARTTGKLAVCAGTSGPGSTNLVTGVACAFADGVPMLVVTGQAASHALGKGAAQETAREDIDIVEMFRPITKYSAMVTSADSLAHHLRRALRQALTGRRGPVHLNIPVDLWGRSAEEDWFDPRTYRPETRAFDRLAVQRAADALLGAEHPVLVVGSGVASAGAEEHLRALAELLPARVATSPRAKGLFPEDDPLSLGILGNAGHRDARETILGDEVDVLFTVGASLGETATFNWTPRLCPSDTLIQLDIDADRIGRNYPVDIPLVGDAQAILVELVYHLHRRIRDGASPASRWRERPPLVRGHARYDDALSRISDAVPLHPERWRADLEEVLPEDAVVFSDIGGHMLFNLHHLCIGRRQRFFINLGFGSMGHGTVAPIGAAFAMPGRPVFALVGDSCFAMNGMELITAAEHDTPVIWIVESNNMHGITWHCSKLLSGGPPMRAAVYKRPLEVAALARAMGLNARVVDRPGQMQQAVRDLLRIGGPGVIEVRVDPTVCPPLGERAKALAGFIE